MQTINPAVTEHVLQKVSVLLGQDKHTLKNQWKIWGERLDAGLDVKNICSQDIAGLTKAFIDYVSTGSATNKKLSMAQGRIDQFSDDDDYLDDPLDDGLELFSGNGHSLDAAAADELDLFSGSKHDDEEEDLEDELELLDNELNLFSGSKYDDDEEDLEDELELLDDELNLFSGSKYDDDEEDLEDDYDDSDDDDDDDDNDYNTMMAMGRISGKSLRSRFSKDVPMGVDFDSQNQSMNLFLTDDGKILSAVFGRKTAEGAWMKLAEEAAKKNTNGIVAQGISLGRKIIRSIQMEEKKDRSQKGRRIPGTNRFLLRAQLPQQMRRYFAVIDLMIVIMQKVNVNSGQEYFKQDTDVNAFKGIQYDTNSLLNIPGYERKNYVMTKRVGSPKTRRVAVRMITKIAKEAFWYDKFSENPAYLGLQKKMEKIAKKIDEKLGTVESRDAMMHLAHGVLYSVLESQKISSTYNVTRKRLANYIYDEVIKSVGKTPIYEPRKLPVTRKPVVGPRLGAISLMNSKDDFSLDTKTLSKMLTGSVAEYLENNPLQAAWAASVTSTIDDKTGKIIADLFLLVPNHPTCLKTVESNIENKVGVQGYLARALLSPHPNPELNGQDHLLPLGKGSPIRFVEGAILHHLKRDQASQDGAVAEDSRWLSETDNMGGDLNLIEGSEMECVTGTNDAIEIAAPTELKELIQAFRLTPVYYRPKGF